MVTKAASIWAVLRAGAMWSCIPIPPAAFSINAGHSGDVAAGPR
jgi:hypothetical protein